MKKNGFTLVELLAVIAIISILATVAVSAVISIYNSSIKKTMVLQENNISDVSKTYLEDFCLDPLPGSEYVCPSTYTNKHYICLSNLKDKRNQYIEGATYKNKECNGIIIFEMDKYGAYSKPKTYLYCDYDSSSKKYNYVTDETLNISDYPVCNIASVIDDTTTSTTTTTTKPVQTDCTYNGTLKQGAEYVNGQYTYIYKKKHNGFSWVNMSEDGWGVTLTDKDSTDAVTSKVCTYINNKPIVSMSYMFGGSKATTLDLSNFDTSNVTDMSKMFQSSKATTLDVSNFDTSNITDMSRMFDRSQATTLDLSNFDTSNVTDMSWMFWGSKATTLDVSNFNTSKVTNMNCMFSSSQATTLDVSNFDTSNVTDMGYMFYNSTNLKTIYVSNKFNTDKVTYSTNMFSGCTNLVGGAGTKYDSTKIDKTYARIDGGTSNPGYFTSIPEPNSFSTDSWMTIVKAVKSGNISKYNVGDTKTVNLGTYGTHTLRVANISKSDSCGNSGYSESGCGFVIEFADIITNRVINSTSTTRGSWSATTIRTFVNNDIYNLLPTDLKNGILNTNVITGHGNSESNNSTSTDKLYLLSPIEIYGSVSTSYDSAINVTNQLDYYKQNNVSLKSYDSAIKNTVVSGGTGSANAWWTRTPAQIMDGQFMMVTNTGNLYSTYLTQELGVSPAFRIG